MQRLQLQLRLSREKGSKYALGVFLALAEKRSRRQAQGVFKLQVETYRLGIC